MDLSNIIAISGKSGLFSVVSQTKTGMLVQSLVDGSKVPVFPTDKVSALEDISIYTTKEDTPLKEVLKTIFTNLNGEKAIDPKSDKKELFAFMDKVYPDWDRDRIYPSDLKKLFSWYNLLVELKLIDTKEEEEKDTKSSENSDDK